MFTRFVTATKRFVENRKLWYQGIGTCMCCKNHWGVVQMKNIPICETSWDLERLCPTGQSMAPICTDCFDKLEVEEIIKYVNRLCGESVKDYGLDRMLTVRDLVRQTVLKMKGGVMIQ